MFLRLIPIVVDGFKLINFFFKLGWVQGGAKYWMEKQSVNE